MIEALAAKLNAIDGADVVVCDYAKSRTHLDVLAAPAALRAAAQVLRDEEFLVESACAVPAGVIQGCETTSNESSRLTESSQR